MFQVVHILFWWISQSGGGPGQALTFRFSFKANHQMTFLMPVKGNQPEESSGKDFLPLENL